MKIIVSTGVEERADFVSFSSKLEQVFFYLRAISRLIGALLIIVLYDLCIQMYVEKLET